MTKESQAKRISLSVLISVFTLLISFLTSFFFTRFLLAQPQIGDVNYGLKTTVDSLVSFVSIFTFGMSSTFIRFRSKYKDKESAVISSFNLITAIIAFGGLLFGVLLIVLAHFNLIIDPAKGIYTEAQKHDFILILIISISYTALSIVLSNNKWYLESEKRIVIVRLINLLVVLLYPIVSIGFVLAGFNMVGVTLVYSVVYLAGFVSYLIIRAKTARNFGFLKIQKVNKALIAEIVRFIFFVLLASCAETVNQGVDKFILTTLLTSSLTTLYQLSITMNQVMLSFCDIIYAPFIPYLSESITAEKREDVQRTFNNVNFLLLFLTCLILAGFASAGKEFVVLWLGEERTSVYFFTIALFSAWPLYGMVKFSGVVQRLFGKHYWSSLLYLSSILIHLAITFPLVSLLGVWACVLGTTISMVFLGVAFVFYNRRVLQLDQKPFLLDLLRFLLATAISCGAAIGIGFLLPLAGSSLSNIALLLIKAIICSIVFVCCFFLLFRERSSWIIKRFFNEEFSQKNYRAHCYRLVLREKLKTSRKRINAFFPFFLIIYFALNFASFYLEGLSFLTPITTSGVFIYGTKAISYLLFFGYTCLFVGANDVGIEKKNILPFIVMFLLSLLSVIFSPNSPTFYVTNQYQILLEVRIEKGLIDTVISLANFAIDLFVMFAYVCIFAGHVEKRQLHPFLLFVIVFTLLECFYSFIFQYNDYLYFFQKATGSGSFVGYQTNLAGTFFSKNGFGYLLFQGIIACIFELFLTKKRRYFLPLALFHLVLFFSLCKTALIAALLLDFVIGCYLLRKQFLFHRKRFFAIIFSSLFLIFSTAITLAILQDNPAVGALLKKIKDLFFTSGSATTQSRLYIWSIASHLCQGPYVILGYGKTLSADYLYALSGLSTRTFHNGLLDILCSYGVVGLVFYLYQLISFYQRNIQGEKSGRFKVLLVGVICAVFAYGMMENVFLFMSSSSIMLVANVVLLNKTPASVEKRKEALRYEMYL